MTTDNNSGEQIPAEYKISARQAINDFNALLEYLAKVNCIDVEGTLRCYLDYGPITRQPINGRMFFKFCYKKWGLVFASDLDALKHYDSNEYALSDKAKQAGCMRFLWPTKDKIVYREDGFRTRGLDFRYVEQRDLRFPPPLSETEQAELNAKKAKAKAEDDELDLQFYFGGSEERRRAACQHFVNGMAALYSIDNIHELLAYVGEVQYVYASGEYDGRQYNKERMRIDITNKYIWLDDAQGNMVRLPRPNQRGIRYEGQGFSTGGFTFAYITPPRNTRIAGAMIRKRQP